MQDVSLENLDDQVCCLRIWMICLLGLLNITENRKNTSKTKHIQVETMKDAAPMKTINPRPKSLGACSPMKLLTLQDALDKVTQ